MNRQEWRGQLFRHKDPDRKRFFYALMMDNVERWTIVPTLRPQSVAEHSFNVAIIADAFCEELELGRGSLVRTEATRWALWHDADEIFTGDIPTPMKMQIPKDVMKAASTLSGTDIHLEECSNSLSFQIVKLADLVESCRFINTWGMNPSKKSITDSLKGQIRGRIEDNLNLRDLALLASQFIVEGDIQWWMERITYMTATSKLNNSSETTINMKDLLSQSKTTLLTQCGRNSSRILIPKEKKGRSGLKK